MDGWIRRDDGEVVRMSDCMKMGQGLNDVAISVDGYEASSRVLRFAGCDYYVYVRDYVVQFGLRLAARYGHIVFTVVVSTIYG